MRPDQPQNASTTASAAASGSAAAFHLVHAAPMQGMGYVQTVGGRPLEQCNPDEQGFLERAMDAFAEGAAKHLVHLYLEKASDPEQTLLQKDLLPAWKQRIPHPDPAARAETAPDATTRARLRAKRKK